MTCQLATLPKRTDGTKYLWIVTRDKHIPRAMHDLVRGTVLRVAFKRHGFIVDDSLGLSQTIIRTATMLNDVPLIVVGKNRRPRNSCSLKLYHRAPVTDYHALDDYLLEQADVIYALGASDATQALYLRSTETKMHRRWRNTIASVQYTKNLK